MSAPHSLADHVERLLASPRVQKKRPPRGVAWPIAHACPADLAALYVACDGLELDDGVSVLGCGELRDATDWLILQKGLSWPADLVVVGERRDVVVVLDLDAAGARAGGGVLETAADDLGTFERVATSVLGYLLVHAGGLDDAPPPEVAARDAARAGDRERLERELARPLYPGQERLFGALAIELGALHAASGEVERALGAFERGVEARAAAVGRGGRTEERAAAWRSAAHASRRRGAAALAVECERRAAASVTP